MNNMSEQELLETYRPLLIAAAKRGKSALYKAIVNTPFTDELGAAKLFLGIVVLLLINEKTQTIDRIALSDTRLAKGTLKMSVKPFRAIKIPIDYYENVIAEALHTGQPQATSDWRYLFEPALSAEEARFNQAGGGIGYSAVYPFTNGAPAGALIFSYYQFADLIKEPHHSFMSNYTELVSSVLHSQGS
jgi:hypothetical protein